MYASVYSGPMTTTAQALRPTTRATNASVEGTPAPVIDLIAAYEQVVGKPFTPVIDHRNAVEVERDERLVERHLGTIDGYRFPC